MRSSRRTGLAVRAEKALLQSRSDVLYQALEIELGLTNAEEAIGEVRIARGYWAKRSEPRVRLTRFETGFRRAGPIASSPSSDFRKRA